MALDRGTGETAWTMAGGGVCPFISLDVFGEEDSEALVLCRWNAGKLASAVGSDDVTYPEAPDVDMLGVDQLTGRELWSVPLGNLEHSSDSESFVSNDQSLIVDLAGEIQVVDLTTGDIKAVPEGTYLCERAREQFIAPDLREAGETSPFVGGDARFLCDQSGAEIKSDALSVAALTDRLRDLW